MRRDGSRRATPGRQGPGDSGPADSHPTEFSRTSDRHSGFRARRAPGTRSSDPDDEFETMATGDAANPASPPQPARSGPSLKARAVGYLSRREHARSELARKLRPYAEDPAQIDAVLDDLQREGWLSDARFAQSLVHRRAPQRGTARVVQELKQHGVDEAQVADLRDQLRATEYDRALEAWRKRFGDKPADRTEYARQARFLAGRGFAHDVIRRILGEADED